MDYEHSETPKTWVDKSAATGPALLGAAAGLILGEVLHGNARKAAALGLLGLGVAALAPKVSGAVKNKVAGPQTKRGSRKTLDGIRGGVSTPEDFGFVDEADLEDQVVV